MTAEHRLLNICPGQKFIDLAVEMPIDDFGEDIGQVVLRFNADETLPVSISEAMVAQCSPHRRSQQREHYRRVFGEKPAFSGILRALRLAVRQDRA